jgi:hypothetical protein
MTSPPPGRAEIELSRSPRVILPRARLKIWGRERIFPELLACLKRPTLQRDVSQASPHELSAIVFDSL